MKNADQIANFIIERIGHIYFRPLMYGGTPEGVELILENYHDLWAEIYDQQENYREIMIQAHERQTGGSMGFSWRYSQKHPEASAEEIANHIVSQWRKISKQLGLPIPYKRIREAFQHNEKLRSLFAEEE
jgi:hypothetical protein